MEESQYKYHILFPIPEPQCSVVRAIMDDIAVHTKLPAPYTRLVPHVTLQGHITGIRGVEIRRIVQSSVSQIRQTRITVSNLFPFGKQYIVLPVHATEAFASLWVTLRNLLSQLPGYVHGEFDADNTLHVTVAQKIAPIFDDAWPRIKHLSISPLTIPVERIELHRRLVNDTSKWEKIETFSIPK